MMSDGNDDPMACEIGPDCDDGLFCNGVELCEMALCAPGTPPCPVACAEAADACLATVTLEVQGFTTTLGAGCFAVGMPYVSGASSVDIVPPPPPASLPLGEALTGQVVSVQQDFRQDSTAAGGFGYACTFTARVLADGVEFGTGDCDTDSDQGVLSCTATLDALVP